MSTSSPTTTSVSPEKSKASHKRPPRTSRNASSSRQRFNDTASKGSFGLKQPNTRRNTASNTGSSTPTHNNPQHRSCSSPCNDSVGAPSSVHLASECPLQRDDLSDLSGSYINGQRGGGGGGGTSTTHTNNTATSHSKQAVVVPQTACSPSSTYQKPWKHAKVLSSRRLPQHPQPPADDDLSVGIRKGGAAASNSNNNNNSNSMSILATSFADVIEVAIDTAEALSLSDENNNNAAVVGHTRTPLVLLLMDPGRKTYELMQLWIDVSTDTVKDILQAVSRNLMSESWRQDYDGIFGVRNNHFSQLVLHAEYDVKAYEIWVCKPWSMSAKATVGYASTLLNHLKNIGVLTYAKTSDYGSSNKWKQLLTKTKKNNCSSSNNNNSDDTILVLSKKALSRVYVPEGVLKHHHACQFLSFTPEFEEDRTAANYYKNIRVDVLSGGGVDDNASALSDSNAPSEREECSVTESTYSTTGTNSPKTHHHRSNKKDNHPSTTKDSVALQRHIGELPLSSPLRKQQDLGVPQPGRLVRLLSALNCAKRADSDVMRQRSPTSTILNEQGEMYRVWEEEASVDSRPSVVSASAPLLFATSPMSEWLNEELEIENTTR